MRHQHLNGLRFLSLIAVAGIAGAQEFPSKTIRFVTTAPGSSSDFTVRIIAQGISGPLGQPVIVDNRATAGISAELVAKSAPDGYTLLYGGGGIWIETLLRKTGYDMVRDFAPVILVSSSPAVLVVHPSMPVKSVKELIALAKARPGELNYPTSAIGGASHLSSELLKAMAGINIVQIPYKGTAPAIAALLGGQVHLQFEGGASLTPYLKSGRLRPLAVTTLQPSVLFPDLPTVESSGLPGFESTQMNVVFSAIRTPDANIRRLNQEMVRFLNRPEAKEKLLAAGVELVASSQEELGAKMKTDMAKWGKLIKDLGIRLD